MKNRVSIWLFAACVTCVTTLATAPAQAKIKIDDTLESQFQRLLNAPSVEVSTQKWLEIWAKQKFVEEQGDRAIDRYNQELEDRLSQRARGAELNQDEPMSSPTYTELLKLWQLHDRYQETIEYINRRSVEVQFDSRLTPDLRLRANALIQKAIEPSDLRSPIAAAAVMDEMKMISIEAPNTMTQTTSPCPGGLKICPSPGESGNIIGANFPKGVLAFTFDDGPASQSTGDMLELLHNYHDSVNPVAKGTFFWLAQQVLRFPKWVARAHAYGYPLENHSYDHKDLSRLNQAGRQFEIVTANEVLTREYRKVDPNYVISFYRCPYGSCYAPKIPQVRQMIADQNQIHVYWRVDSLDWKLLNSAKVAALVIKQIQLVDHGVILMHDIHPPTVGAMRLVLDWIKSQNDNHGAHYKLVTIPEAVALVNGAL